MTVNRLRPKDVHRHYITKQGPHDQSSQKRQPRRRRRRDSSRRSHETDGRSRCRSTERSQICALVQSLFLSLACVFAIETFFYNLSKLVCVATRGIHKIFPSCCHMLKKNLQFHSTHKDLRKRQARTPTLLQLLRTPCLQFGVHPK